MKLILENWKKYLEESSRWPNLELVPEQEVKKIIVNTMKRAADKEKIRSALIIAHQALKTSVNDPDTGDVDPHELAVQIDPADLILKKMPNVSFDKAEAVLIGKALVAMGLPDAYARNIAQVVRRG